MITALPAIDARIEPMRTLAGHGAASPRRVPFQPVQGQNYFAAPLTFASFLAGASDYDLVADELYCPCGEVLTWDDLNLGTAVEIADWHIAEAHPDATAKARAKRRRAARS